MYTANNPNQLLTCYFTFLGLYWLSLAAMSCLLMPYSHDYINNSKPSSPSLIKYIALSVYIAFMYFSRPRVPLNQADAFTNEQMRVKQRELECICDRLVCEDCNMLDC